MQRRLKGSGLYYVHSGKRREHVHRLNQSPVEKRAKSPHFASNFGSAHRLGQN
jgi:hypothetical protein